MTLKGPTGLWPSPRRPRTLPLLISPVKLFLIVQILLSSCGHSEPQPQPAPIMTLPSDGSVYSLFPDEDLRTGRKFHRFPEDDRNRGRAPALPPLRGGHQIYSSAGTAPVPGRNPALFRERQSGPLPPDRYRFRGEASFVSPNTQHPNANYIVRPLDRSVAFDDDRVRGGGREPNYFSSYRNRDLPFDRLPPLPPNRFVPSTRERRPMELERPTIHIYDPKSQSFIPKGTVLPGREGGGQPLPGPIIPPDPRIKVKPGRLLIPGLHNSLSSEEAGPETFLNHEEYLDYHTNVELDRLAELDRKMKAMQAKSSAGGYGDARVVLFKGGSEASQEEEEEEGGSYEGGEEKQQPSQIHGEKSKVLQISSPSLGPPTRAPSPTASWTTYSTTSTARPPAFVDRRAPLSTLPSHLRDEASPSRLLQKLKAQRDQQQQQQLRPKVDTGTNNKFSSPSAPAAKGMKSAFGTEAAQKTIEQNHNHGGGSGIKKPTGDERVPASALRPPAPINANHNPILQQKTKAQLTFSAPTSHDHDRGFEIIPSIVTQSGTSTGGDDGLLDGHFDIVPGVPAESGGFGLGLGRNLHSFRNSDIADDFDDNVARFRHASDSKTPPFLYLETKQLQKMKADIKSAHATIVPVPKPAENVTTKSGGSGNGNKKMILVKRIKHLDSHHNSSSSAASSQSKSRSKSNREYESTMTVHKIQETSDEKEKLDGGPFSAEKATDFNLQSQGTSSSAKGVVSKIHAHVSSCPKLDGPSEIICDVHIRKRHGNLNPHLTVGWKRKFYNVTQPDIIVAVNKTLAYEEDFHDKFNVTLAPGINPMLRSVLLIKHVNPKDTGNYQCEVTDGENQLKSETLLFLCH